MREWIFAIGLTVIFSQAVAENRQVVTKKALQGDSYVYCKEKKRPEDSIMLLNSDLSQPRLLVMINTQLDKTQSTIEKLNVLVEKPYSISDITLLSHSVRGPYGDVILYSACVVVKKD